MLQAVLGIPAFISILLGYGLVSKKFLKIEFSHGLVFSFSCLLSVYFIAALLFILDPLIYCSFALGGGFFVYILIDFFKRNELANFLELFTQDVIVFIITVIWFYIGLKNLSTFGNWDEYSYWGIVIKEMNFYHGLRSNPSYPSAALPKFMSYVALPTIFQYAATKLLSFKEAYIVFASASISVVFNSIFLVHKSFIWSIILPCIAILPALCFDVNSLNSLYLDTTIGIVFAATIAMHIQTKTYNNQTLTLILVAPLLFILPNIKEVGYWFSFIAIGIIFIDQIISRNYRYLKIVPLLALLPLSAKLMWSLYLAKWHVDISFSQLPFSSIYNIYNLDTNSSSESLFDLKSHANFSMKKWVMIKSIINQMLPFFYCKSMQYTYVIAAITAYILYKNNTKILKNFLFTMMFLLFGLALYFIFRTELYLTKYDLYEAIRVASYERYIGSYSIIFAACCASYLKNLIENEQLKRFSLSWLALLVIGSFMTKATIPRVNFARSIDTALFYQERQTVIKDLISKGTIQEQGYKNSFKSGVDCFVYNYLNAPKSNLYEIVKCYDELNDTYNKQD